MTQPPTGPATLEATRLQLSLVPADTSDDSFITTVVDAVNAVVRDIPSAQLDGPELEAWPPNVLLGANILAARLVRRRNSPSGVEALTDQGAIFVPRNDPDVALMLRLGAYQKPVVG